MSSQSKGGDTSLEHPYVRVNQICAFSFLNLHRRNWQLQYKLEYKFEPTQKLHLKSPNNDDVPHFGYSVAPPKKLRSEKRLKA